MSLTWEYRLVRETVTPPGNLALTERRISVIEAYYEEEGPDAPVVMWCPANAPEGETLEEYEANLDMLEDAVISPGLPPQTVHHWVNRGVLHLRRRGSGYGVEWTPEEARAARAVDSLRRLAGITTCSGDAGVPHRQLRKTVAEAARTNPPGAVVELPCPVPFIRMVLVVPEDVVPEEDGQRDTGGEPGG